MAIGLWAMNQRGPSFVIFRATLKITRNSAAFEASTRRAPPQSYQEGYSDQSQATPFLKCLLEKTLCPDRFPWPHSELHSQGYQICFTFGTAHEYNWNHAANRAAWQHHRMREVN